MAAFNAVGLRAVRDHQNRTVVVDVDVDLTSSAAAIDLKRTALKQYSDGSALVCELIVTDGAGDIWLSKNERFHGAYARKYVVLAFQGAVIGVAPIENG